VDTLNISLVPRHLLDGGVDIRAFNSDLLVTEDLEVVSPCLLEYIMGVGDCLLVPLLERAVRPQAAAARQVHLRLRNQLTLPDAEVQPLVAFLLLLRDERWEISVTAGPR